MAWTDLVEPGLVISPSPLDSDRFGLRMVRVTAGDGVRPDELIRAMDALDADIVVARYPAASQPLAAAFAATRFSVLPAGALVYWSRSVGDPMATPGDLAVVSAASFDADAAAVVVHDVIQDSFYGYGNHYTANPLLDRAAALAGYQDWATRSLRVDAANVLILTHDDAAVGVATLGIGGDHVEILLAGLVPEAQGRGWYATLLAGCEARARELGRRLVVISTQVHNVRVQRAWVRAGFRPLAAIETLHLVDPGALRRASGRAGG